MGRDDEQFRRNEDASPARAGRRAVREDDDEPVPLEIDAEEEESPFLRGQRRVPVRRSPLPKKTANRLKKVAILCVVLLVCAGIFGIFYNYGTRSWRFRLESSDNVEVSGIENVTKTQVMELFGGDIGKNIFFVPLEERRKELEEIPWVQSASVMRLLPNRIKIGVTERTPVAFVQIGSKISLIDSNGVVMEFTPRPDKKYSFPVIVGTSNSEPLSTRAARMKIFLNLLRELDSEGAGYSQRVSEVDLSDPEDIKVTASDSEGAVLVHMGSSNFLPRFKLYVAHVQEWRQQVPELLSVDLRYAGQVILNPETRGAVPVTNRSSKPANKAS
jgi:cell division protein FtsQ